MRSKKFCPSPPETRPASIPCGIGFRQWQVPVRGTPLPPFGGFCGKRGRNSYPSRHYLVTNGGRSVVRRLFGWQRPELAPLVDVGPGWVCKVLRAAHDGSDGGISARFCPCLIVRA